MNFGSSSSTSGVPSFMQKRKISSSYLVSQVGQNFIDSFGVRCRNNYNAADFTTNQERRPNRQSGYQLSKGGKTKGRAGPAYLGVGI
jgi:hypothetical protein